MHAIQGMGLNRSARSSLGCACSSGIFKLGVACVLLGAIFSPWGRTTFAHDPSKVMSPFEGMGKIPFLVVGVVYGMQMVVVGVVLRTLTLRVFHHGSLAAQMQGVERSLWVFLFISAIGCVMYWYLWFGSGTFLLLTSSDGGPYLLLRNVFWLFSTPAQWFAFTHSCTKTSNEYLTKVITSTIALQILGIVMLAMPNFGLYATCFVLSSVFFARMIGLVLKFSIVQEFDFIAHRLLHLDIIVWVCYPVAHAMRQFGLISPWTEQVLIYSILDICTKTVTFSAIVMIHAYIILNGANEALQVINALTPKGPQP